MSLMIFFLPLVSVSAFLMQPNQSKLSELNRVCFFYKLNLELEANDVVFPLICQMIVFHACENYVWWLLENPISARYGQCM